MKKSKIYTKTGDAGETGLVSGNRISKSDLRIDLYGELDELNSRIGVSTSLMATDDKLEQTIEFLQVVQSEIFNLGSNLACEVENRKNYKLPQLEDAFIKNLEDEIDRLDHELPALKNFILPGGTPAAASLHLCRTGARNVERRLVYFQNERKEELPQNSLIFLNRLSDYLFILARYVNIVQLGPEILWKPGKS